jgi:Ca-activated chloride channel family protein
MNCQDQFQAEDPFGGGGFNQQFGGGGFRRDIDEDTLKQIADMTSGKYYAATSASELQDVFQSLPTYVIATRENIEISVFFTAFAVLIAILALILSLRWHPLP